MQDDILAGLNPAQREGVTAAKGPVPEGTGSKGLDYGHASQPLRPHLRDEAGPAGLNPNFV